MPNDDEENTIHGMDDADKYRLLKFWKSCELSKKHLDSIQDVIEIVINREFEPYTKSFNSDIARLEKLIDKERKDRELEDALVNQRFSIAKWVTGTALTIFGLCIGYMGLK